MIGNVSVLDPNPAAVTRSRKEAKMAEPTAMQRRAYAKAGWARGDGSYYVRPDHAASDLQNAIDAVGRGENAGDSGAAIRKHIMKRAAECNMSDKIPDTWAADGTLKHFDVSSFLAENGVLVHHGVLGMKWGHHRGAHSEDSAHARGLQVRIKEGGGPHVLENPELETLNKRLQLEQTYGQLTSKESNVQRGRKAVKDVFGDVKTGVDAVDTARKVHKIYKDVKG